jgi:hypothetical protein
MVEASKSKFLWFEPITGQLLEEGGFMGVKVFAFV